jgi:hypothetical protein
MEFSWPLYREGRGFDWMEPIPKEGESIANLA